MRGVVGRPIRYEVKPNAVFWSRDYTPCVRLCAHHDASTCTGWPFIIAVAWVIFSKLNFELYCMWECSTGTAFDLPTHITYVYTYIMPQKFFIHCVYVHSLKTLHVLLLWGGTKVFLITLIRIVTCDLWWLTGRPSTSGPMCCALWRIFLEYSLEDLPLLSWGGLVLMITCYALWRISLKYSLEDLSHGELSGYLFLC